ncbi:kinase-like protein [Ceratobasidium sp. AG-I]|nr:kinase-like protein [Ceratobasidium sp. AG-I]
MYVSSRRGRQGVAAAQSTGFRADLGPDYSDYSVASRVSDLGLTIATLTPQVEERINWLLDEIILRRQFKENSFELVAYACALEKEKDARLLALVLDLMFQKLRDNPEVDANACARMCYILMVEIVPSMQDKKTVDSNGQPVMGHALLLKYMVDRFHLLGEQSWQNRESVVMFSDRSPEDSRIAASAITRWLNFMILTDDLWGRYILGESDIHTVVEKQLSVTKPREPEIIRLLAFIRPRERLARDGKMKDRMDAHLSRVKDMLENDKVDSACRDRILNSLPHIIEVPVSLQSPVLPMQKVNLEITESHPLADPPALTKRSSGEATTVLVKAAEILPTVGQSDPPQVDPALLEDQKFYVTATTPLTWVIAFFTQFADTPVDDYTSELKNASYVSSDPVITSSLSDIYRATLRKGTHIAVKCVRTAVSGNQKVLKHTVQELGAWSTLDHINVLRLLGIALFKDRLAMVSEWMEQGSIISALKIRPEVDRYALCIQIVGVVAWLHGKKLVHGDLKGANILMSEDGIPKLTDFGLAIMQEEILNFSTTFQGGGTMRWMAPELFLENPARSYKTDVYALGMTILEILTCQDPFQEIQGTEIMYTVTVKKKMPRRPEHLAEKTPRNELFWSAMCQCWVHEPSRRATAQEIADLLDSAGEVQGDKSDKKRSSLCCTVA